jgi:hypothetical protein
MNHEPINEYIFLKEDKGLYLTYMIYPSLRVERLRQGDKPAAEISYLRLEYKLIHVLRDVKVGSYYVYQCQCEQRGHGRPC